MKAPGFGYYCQFCIKQERLEEREPTGKTIGLDVGLTHFYTDSDGNTVENQRQESFAKIVQIARNFASLLNVNH